MDAKPHLNLGPGRTELDRLRQRVCFRLESQLAQSRSERSNLVKGFDAHECERTLASPLGATDCQRYVLGASGLQDREALELTNHQAAVINVDEDVAARTTDTFSGLCAYGSLTC
jgi:hypothetical protein